VAKTCRYYGITSQTFYKWAKRYSEEGDDGLRDRSRRPLTSPNATSLEVVGKVFHLRQNYHVGPQKISMYLKATPRCRSAAVGGLAHPGAPEHESVADLSTLRAPLETGILTDDARRT
jgi:hypothetical protein